MGKGNVGHKVIGKLDAMQGRFDLKVIADTLVLFHKGGTFEWNAN